MILFSVILGSLLLYSKSKYFNKDLNAIQQLTARNKGLTRLLGYSLIALATYYLVQAFDVATGLTLSFFLTSMVLSLMIMILPLHRNFVYLFGVVGLFALVLEAV